MVPNVGPFVVTDLLCRCCPTMGKSGTENLRRQRGYGWRIGCPVGDDFRGTRIEVIMRIFGGRASAL
jgi:hypothetical protein